MRAQAVRTGLGLKAQINLRSVFDRKNYFYPDLPQGYQISQYKSPIVGEGEVIVDLRGRRDRHASASSGCIWSRTPASRCTTSSPTMSFVDLNRSGVALMEIVSKPDIRSSEQAKAYVTKLRSILRYLGTCDGDMEKGSCAPTSTSRCASRASRSARAARSRTSTRSASSARRSNTRRAARSTSSRMAARSIRRRGCSIPTRARPARCAPRKRRTTTAISPIPTCCRWNSSEAYVDELKAQLPELPDEKKARFIADFGLSPYDAGVLVAERESADFFETVLAKLADKAATASSPPTG